MKIDGIASSEHLDSSGEVLSIEGHDISDLEEGKGVLNFEHDEEKSVENILGKITFAKKILSQRDCSNDRETMYWNLCKKPFVYIIAELFDDEEHPGAVAAAALIRYYARRGEKILAGFSVEGQTLERDNNFLKQSVGRRVALTLRPCNKSCVSGLLEDPQSRRLIEKSEGRIDSRYLYEVSTVILSDTIEIPEIVVTAADLAKSVQELRKTLEGGGYNAAPSTLTQGAALAREEIVGPHMKNRIKAAVRDWPRTRPLKEWLKAELPELSPSYIDHFSDVAHEVGLKKGEKPLLRIGFHNSPNLTASEPQKNLVDGLFLDQSKPMKPGWNNSHDPRRVKNDRGQEVVIKDPKESFNSREAALNSTAYHAVASNAMGMGAHVPVTNHFKHPDLEKPSSGPYHHSAQEFLAGHRTAFGLSEPEQQETYQRARETGDLHKLAILDHVLGADKDRHGGNIMIDKGGKIKHIDNDDAFTYSDLSPISVYHENADLMQDTLPVEAMKWLHGIDPNRVAYVMRQNGLPHSDIEHALRRLQFAKDASKAGHSMRSIVGAEQHEDIE